MAHRADFEWDDAAKDKLRQLWGTMPREDLYLRFPGRTIASVKSQARKLGLPFGKPPANLAQLHGSANRRRHEWGPSRVGHGEQQCRHCLITNREAAALGEEVYCLSVSN